MEMRDTVEVEGGREGRSLGGRVVGVVRYYDPWIYDSITAEKP